MQFAFLKVVGVILILSVSTLANAIIIDNGSYTTVDGLDWLDFSATINMTQAEALAANSGWRAASLFEASSMMDAFFGRELVYTNMQSDYRTLDDGIEIAKMFAPLFGATNDFGYARATAETVGFIGVTRQYVVTGFKGVRTDYMFEEEGFRSDSTGIALVRGYSNVTEPTPLAIFALVLAGLASRRFKKQS
jgi:hypothetical protein